MRGQASDNVLDHAVREIFLFGVGAQVLERQHRDRRPVGYRRRRGRRRGGCADPHAIGAHRAGNVFDLLFAQILKRKVDLIADLVAHDPAHTDPAGLGQGFEAGGEVDAVAVNVAPVDDNIAEINTDAELDPPFSRDVSVALGHRALDFGRAAHCADDAGKLDQHAVAGGFDKTAAVLRELRIDQFA